MPEPLTTTAAILTIMAHAGTIAGRTKLLASKIKNKLKSFALTDTLESLETMQQGAQLPAAQQQELTKDLDLVFEENPDLSQVIQQLIDKEASNDANLGQIIKGNVNNNASGQATIISGNTNGDVNVAHHHHVQNNHGDIDIQLNNSSVGGDINRH